MPALTVVKSPKFGQPDDIDEPDWTLLIPDPVEGDTDNAARWRALAGKEWNRITRAMRTAETLAPENRHQIQRLVLAYIRYDLAASRMFAKEAIILTVKTQTPMLNLWQVEMRAADADATQAEMELGIPPRRRGSVTKVKAKPKQVSGANAYLSQVKKS